MNTIPLTHGKFALVDDDDYERASAFTWYYSETRQGRSVMVYTFVKVSGIKKHRVQRCCLLLWHLIRGHRPGKVVDHVNGNRLDNRKANLRHATYKQNAQNARPSFKSRSGFKGVSKTKSGQYAAWITDTANGQRKHLGDYKEAAQAADAYDAAAKQIYGEFAYQNQRRKVERIKEARKTPRRGLREPIRRERRLPRSYSLLKTSRLLGMPVNWIKNHLHIFPHRFWLINGQWRMGECRIPMIDFAFLMQQLNTHRHALSKWDESTRYEFWECVRDGVPFSPPSPCVVQKPKTRARSGIFLSQP